RDEPDQRVIRILAATTLVLVLAGCAREAHSTAAEPKSSSPSSVASTITGLPSPSAAGSADPSTAEGPTSSATDPSSDAHVLTYELSTDKETALLVGFFRDGDAVGAISGNIDPLIEPNTGWTETVTIMGPIPYGRLVLTASTSVVGPKVTCSVLLDGTPVVTQSVDGSSQYQSLSCSLPKG
ncbi:MAG: hypothetical protein QOD50_1225, partial [Actinomycetota bacterium]|nr:hypothetical protein [Actinomycetota bacterium]